MDEMGVKELEKSMATEIAAQNQPAKSSTKSKYTKTTKREPESYLDGLKHRNRHLKKTNPDALV
jgi:hypothetical protein